MATISFEYHENAQTTFKPPLIANENAFLGDVSSSEKNDSKAPISSGFYRLEKGEHPTPQPATRAMTDLLLVAGTPLVYKYTYHEMKIILEGSFEISDETGKTVTATKGDVFYFPAGSTITFKTDDYGLAFYVGQRKEGAA